MASSCTIVLIILILHFSESTGVNFTFLNKCSETIWPAILGRGTSVSTGFDILQGKSLAFQPSRGWTGRLWGKTGCTFDDSVQGSCATGDCRIDEVECNVTGVTLVEFSLGSKMDYYDVSLIEGYNLPLLVVPSGGSGQCLPTGCVEDLNQRCPPELRTEGGACRSACNAFKTEEYCCAGEYNTPSTCRPSNYSQMFKKACPKAYTYAYDDPNTIFSCSGADYFITFCPAYDSLQGMSPVQSPGYPPESGSAYPQTKNGSSAGAREIIIITAVELGIIGVIIASITRYCFLKRQKSSAHSKECKEDIENFLLQHGSLTPKRYKYSEIKKITKSFSDRLGKGVYGSVYKGISPDGRLVAVKVLIETDSNGEEFINEVASISRTSHVNIVSLLGFSYEGNKRALVYEFMPNKSLDKFLSNNRSADDTDCLLDLEKLHKIAVGIAKGLEYLHTGCSTRIVHFDIKPQNILLDEDFCPKISDFGLAKLCKKKQSILSVIGTRGTIGYIAPEIFSRNFGGVSHKSDVYSYGMMVLEMSGARKIFKAEVNQSSENYFPDKLYERVIIDITNKLDNFMIDEEEEEETRKKMFLIGFWCIQTNPLDRPSISKVVEMLEGSLQSIQIPPKPFQFSPNLSGLEISSSFSAHVETENSAQDQTPLSEADTINNCNG